MDGQMQQIREELVAAAPHLTALGDLAADDDIAAQARIDSLVFLQFLTGLERRFKIDLSENIDDLKAVRTLADLDRIVTRRRGGGR